MLSFHGIHLKILHRFQNGSFRCHRARFFLSAQQIIPRRSFSQDITTTIVEQLNKKLLTLVSFTDWTIARRRGIDTNDDSKVWIILKKTTKFTLQKSNFESLRATNNDTLQMKYYIPTYMNTYKRMIRLDWLVLLIFL